MVREETRKICFGQIPETQLREDNNIREHFKRSTEDVSPPNFSERNSGYYERSSRLVADTDSYIRRATVAAAASTASSSSSSSYQPSSSASSHTSPSTAATSSSSLLGAATIAGTGDNRSRAPHRLYNKNGPYTSAAALVNDRSSSGPSNNSNNNNRVPPSSSSSWYDAAATSTNGLGGSGSAGASIAGNSSSNHHQHTYSTTSNFITTPASTAASATHQRNVYSNSSSVIVSSDVGEATTMSGSLLGKSSSSSSRLNRLVKTSRVGSESPTLAMGAPGASALATAATACTSSSSSCSTINSSYSNLSSSSNMQATVANAGHNASPLGNSNGNGNGHGHHGSHASNAYAALELAAAAHAASAAGSGEQVAAGSNNNTTSSTSTSAAIAASNSTTSHHHHHHTSRSHHVHGRSTTSSSRSHSRSPSSYSSSHSSSSSSNASSRSHGSSPVAGSGSMSTAGRSPRGLQSAIATPSSSVTNPSGGNVSSSSCSSTSSTGSSSACNAANPVVHSEDNRPLAIRVRNLPARSSDTSLKDGLFHEYKKHGKVTWVKVVGQNSERYALVCFKKPDDVDKALEVSHDKLFFGCKIEVEAYKGYDVEDNEFRPYEAELDEYHPKSTRTLFIGNLEKDITSEELRSHFDCFGEIIEIEIKKNGAHAYAFCQYSDIVSVVKAMRKMDGEHLGNNRIKLGFGKSMPTNCVWIDGVTEKSSELQTHFSRYGPVTKVVVDPVRHLALVFYDQIQNAQMAVKEMRVGTLRGRRVQVDFASRECQEAFYDKLEKQNAGNRFTNRYDTQQTRSRASSFSRHQNSNDGCSPSNTPGSSSSSGGGSTGTGPTLSSAIVSGLGGGGSAAIGSTLGSNTPGNTTPARSRGSRSSRHTMDYDCMDARRFRCYDEYSQGSAASHEEDTPHSGYTGSSLRSDSPLLLRLGPAVGSAALSTASETHEVTLNSSSGRRRCDKSPPTKQKGDIRILQKERSHLLEQLEECPSSGDESIVSPRKRMKIDHHHSISSGSVLTQSHSLDASSSNISEQHNKTNLNSICDVTPHDRKGEVRRLSESNNSLKYQHPYHLNHSVPHQQQQQHAHHQQHPPNRRPSIDLAATAGGVSGSATAPSTPSLSARHGSTSSTGSGEHYPPLHTSSNSLSTSAACKRRRVVCLSATNVLSSSAAAGNNSGGVANDDYHHHASRGRGHQLHSHHSHEASGGESADGSRPGTPLCDERPEVLPSEPRRLPRERPHEPMVLPLPKFGIQFFHQYRNSIAGAVAAASAASHSNSGSTSYHHHGNSTTTPSSSSAPHISGNGGTSSAHLLPNSGMGSSGSAGHGGININSSSHSSLSHSSGVGSTTPGATSAATSSYLQSPSTRYSHWRPHHHTQHPHYHMPQGATTPNPGHSSMVSPLRPRSLSSNSSDSDAPGHPTGSPSLEERIRTLDEMYERWSGNNTSTSSTNDKRRQEFGHSTPARPPFRSGEPPNNSINQPTPSAGGSNSSGAPSAPARYKFPVIDEKDLKPSETAKTFLAKKSVFDDDLQRLKKNQWYEPASDTTQLARSIIGSCTSPGLPNLAATKTPVVGCTTTNVAKPGALLQRLSSLSPMNSPQASMSPHNSPSPSPSVTGANVATAAPKLTTSTTSTTTSGGQPTMTSATTSSATILSAVSASATPTKTLQYPFPSHPPLPNTAAPPPTVQPAPPAGPAPTEHPPPSAKTSTDGASAAAPITKPKTNMTITKSMSMPWASSSTADRADKAISGSTDGRVLTKSVSVPGSTNIGTVKGTNTEQQSVVPGSHSSMSTSAAKQEDGSLRQYKSAAGSSSSKKGEKSHKHNHRSDSSEKKSSKGDKPEKRKNSTASQQSVVSTPHMEEDSSDSDDKDSEKLDKERHGKDKSEKEKPKERQEREKREKELRKQQDREERERKQREERERRDRDEHEKREREERERREREERERREREDKESQQKEERERKAKEERGRKEKEERDRKEREELEHKKREEEERRLNEERKRRELAQTDRVEKDKLERERQLFEGNEARERQAENMRQHQRKKLDSLAKSNANEPVSRNVSTELFRQMDVERQNNKENATEDQQDIAAAVESSGKHRARKNSRNSPIRVAKRRLSSQDSNNGSSANSTPASNEEAAKRMRIETQTSLNMKINERRNSKESHVKDSAQGLGKHHHQRQHSSSSSRHKSHGASTSTSEQGGHVPTPSADKPKQKEHSAKHKNKHHNKHQHLQQQQDEFNVNHEVIKDVLNCIPSEPVEGKTDRHEDISADMVFRSGPPLHSKQNSSDYDDEVAISHQQHNTPKTPSHHKPHREHVSATSGGGSGHHSRHKSKREHHEKKQCHSTTDSLASNVGNNNLTDEEIAQHNPHRRISAASSLASESGQSKVAKYESPNPISNRSVERKSSRCSEESLSVLNVHHQNSNNPKVTPSRKMILSSADSDDSDETAANKKHSIFDIPDDGPYVSMYDKVKARSCKNMQKQEEEKKIKAKFSQLKQSRAKREEKKRSTSYEGDSDSDFEERNHRSGGSSCYKSRNHGGLSSSDDDDDHRDLPNARQRRRSSQASSHPQRMFSDSDSNAAEAEAQQRKLHRNLIGLCDDGDDSSDDEIRSNVRRISSPSKRITTKRNSHTTRIASDSESQSQTASDLKIKQEIDPDESDNKFKTQMALEMLHQPDSDIDLKLKRRSSMSSTEEPQRVCVKNEVMSNDDIKECKDSFGGLLTGAKSYDYGLDEQQKLKTAQHFSAEGHQILCFDQQEIQTPEEKVSSECHKQENRKKKRKPALVPYNISESTDNIVEVMENMPKCSPTTPQTNNGATELGSTEKKRRKNRRPNKKYRKTKSLDMMHVLNSLPASSAAATPTPGTAYSYNNISESTDNIVEVMENMPKCSPLPTKPLTNNGADIDLKFKRCSSMSSTEEPQRHCVENEVMPYDEIKECKQHFDGLLSGAKSYDYGLDEQQKLKSAQHFSAEGHQILCFDQQEIQTPEEKVSSECHKQENRKKKRKHVLVPYNISESTDNIFKVMEDMPKSSPLPTTPQTNNGATELDSIERKRRKSRRPNKKYRKTKSLDMMHVLNSLPASSAAATPTPGTAYSKRGEKFELIFGPISDEESQFSDSESKELSSLSLNTGGTTTSTNITGPIASAALNPYKQEPLTPKSHNVEENGEKKKSNRSRRTNRYLRKKLKEKKLREQQALSALQSQQMLKHVEDENSVDLDEAGRALEAQLMEDSDNKVTDDATPSTATTYRSDMTDVFRFSDGDENSMEILPALASQEKADTTDLNASSRHALDGPDAQQMPQPNKNKEKKKKKRSKEENHHHQRRESSSSTASQQHQRSTMSPPPVGKLTVDVQAAKRLQHRHDTERNNDDEERAPPPVCKPSPSLPCLLDDDMVLQAKPITQTPKHTDLLPLSPMRDKKLISPIPKTPTIGNAAVTGEKHTPTTPLSSLTPAAAGTPTSSFGALAKTAETSSSSTASTPPTSLKKKEVFIPGFDGELDEKISESAVQSISVEFNSSLLDDNADEPKIPIQSPPDASKHLDKMEDTKSRVTISQEETESAVSALLGESFGNSSNADYSFQDDALEDLNAVETAEVVPEVDEEAAIAAKAIESVHEPLQPEEDAEEVSKAVQSLSTEEMDIKADTPQSERDLQIDTDTEENAEEPDSSGQSLKIDENRQERSSSGQKTEIAFEKKVAKEKSPATPQTVITKIESDAPDAKTIVSSDNKPQLAKIEPPTISNLEQPAVKPIHAVLPSMMSLDVPISMPISSTTSSTPSTQISASTPIKSLSLPNLTGAAPTAKQQQQATTSTRPVSAYIMQPPTISIPEQPAHFAVPQLVLSPRGNGPAGSGTSIEQQHQMPGYISVREPSPHSPHSHSRSSTPTRQHSPATVALSPTAMQQHVLIPAGNTSQLSIMQRNQQQQQGQQQSPQMSPPVGGNSSPLPSPTTTGVNQPQPSTPTPTSSITATKPSQSPQRSTDGSVVKVNNFTSSNSSVNKLSVRNPPPPPGKSVIEQHAAPVAGQHTLPIAVQKMPPVPTHPTIISKVVTVQPQQAQQSMMPSNQQTLQKGGMYHAPVPMQPHQQQQHAPPQQQPPAQHHQMQQPQQQQPPPQQKHSPQIMQQISKITAHQQQQQQQYMQQQHILQQKRQQIQQQQQAQRQQHHQQMQQQILQQQQQQILQMQKLHQLKLYPMPTPQQQQQPPVQQQQLGRPRLMSTNMPQHMQGQQHQQPHQQQPQQQTPVATQQTLLQHPQQQQQQHQPSPTEVPHATSIKTAVHQNIMLMPQQPAPGPSPTTGAPSAQNQSQQQQQRQPQQHVIQRPQTPQKSHVAENIMGQRQLSPATQPLPLPTKQQQQQLHINMPHGSVSLTLTQPPPAVVEPQQQQQHKVQPAHVPTSSGGVEVFNKQPDGTLPGTTAEPSKPANDPFIPHDALQPVEKSNDTDQTTSSSVVASMLEKLQPKLAESVSVICSPSGATTPSTIATQSIVGGAATVSKADEATQKLANPRSNEEMETAKADNSYRPLNESSGDSVIKKADAYKKGESVSSMPQQQQPNELQPKGFTSDLLHSRPKSDLPLSKAELNTPSPTPNVEKSTSASEMAKFSAELSQSTVNNSAASTTDHDTEDETETKQMPSEIHSLPIHVSVGRPPSTRGGGAKRGRQPRGGKKGAPLTPSVTTTIPPVDTGVQTRLRKPTPATLVTRGRKGRPPRNLLAQQQQLLQQQQEQLQEEQRLLHQQQQQQQQPPPPSTPVVPTPTTPHMSVLTAAEKKARSSGSAHDQDVYEFHDDSGEESKVTPVAGSDPRPRLILTIKPGQAATIVKATEKAALTPPPPATEIKPLVPPCSIASNISTTANTLSPTQPPRDSVNMPNATPMPLPDMPLMETQQMGAPPTSTVSLEQQQPQTPPGSSSDATNAAHTRKSRRLQEKDRSTIDDIIEDVVRNNAPQPPPANSMQQSKEQTPPRRSGRNAQNPKKTEVGNTHTPNAVGRPRRSKDRKGSADNSNVHDSSPDTERDGHLAERHSSPLVLHTEDEKHHPAGPIPTSTGPQEPVKSIATTMPLASTPTMTTIPDANQPVPVQVQPHLKVVQQQPPPPPQQHPVPQHPKKKALAAAEIESFAANNNNISSTPMSSLPSSRLPVLHSAAPASQKTTGGAADAVNKALIDPVTGVISASMQQGKEGNLPSAAAAAQSGGNPNKQPTDPKKMMQAAMAAAAAAAAAVTAGDVNAQQPGATMSMQAQVQPTGPSPVATPITAPTKPVQVETAASPAATLNTPAALLNKSVSVVVKTATTPTPVVLQQQILQPPTQTTPTPSSTPIAMVNKQPVVMQQSPIMLHAQPTNVRPPTLKAHVLNSQKNLQQQQQQQQQTPPPNHMAQIQQQHIMVNSQGHSIQSNMMARHALQHQQQQQPQMPNAPQHLLVNIPPAHSPQTVGAMSSPHMPHHPQQQQQPPPQHQLQQQPQQQTFVIKGQGPQNTSQVVHVISSKASGPVHMSSQPPPQGPLHGGKHGQGPPQHVTYSAGPPTNAQSQMTIMTSKMQQQQSPAPHHMGGKPPHQQQQQLPPVSVSLVSQPQSLAGNKQHVPPPSPTTTTHVQQQHHKLQPAPTPLVLPAGLLNLQHQAMLMQQQQQHLTASPALQGGPGKHNAAVHTMQAQGMQILPGNVPSPPPSTTLKQTSPQTLPSQPTNLTGANTLRTNIPTISPQGQARVTPLILPTGLPIPKYEANLHDIGGYNTNPAGAHTAQSPPPAHQQASPITPADPSFASAALRGVSPRDYMIYQQMYRPQDSLNASMRCPSGDYDEKLMGNSPPLELRRPGSVPRTIGVPHSLQSPQDRATDSPQVAQVYVHNTRIPPHPHYAEHGFYDTSRQLPIEPPPAHRSAPAHCVVAPPVVVPPPGPGAGSPFIGAPPVQPPPPSTVAASGLPPVGAHMHPAQLLEHEREQRERKREREQQLQRESERMNMTGPLANTNMQPAHEALASVHSIPVGTPPPGLPQSYAPVQSDSLSTILSRHPVMWQGLLALKTDSAAVQMHFIHGNPQVAKNSLPYNTDGSTPPLRIAQRMRLEQTQLEGVIKKMQLKDEHCMLLALPCGRDHADVLQQSRNLQNGFITYLQQKSAAGIVNIPVPGSETAAYVVHIFPSCDFAIESVDRVAPLLMSSVLELDHLLIIIATV